MTRPSDWYPLAFTDPVGGDPEAVRAAGEEYAAVARKIALAAEDLRTIAAEMDGGSAAVEEVDTKATRLADTIERAHGRYAATGAALLTYAGALAHAQELSLAAHAAAVTALQAQDEALASVSRWTRLAHDATDPAVRDRYLASADEARADLALTDGLLEQARADLRVAVAQRDGAVSAACATIRGAMDRDDLHDTIWQDIGGGVQEVGLHVWNGVDEVATLLGVAAVVLCWVPGVNGVLGAAATIAGVLLLFRESVDLASGNGTAHKVRAAALGVATFGVGRFAQQGIRLSVATARGGRALQHSGLADEGVVAAGSRAASRTATVTGVERGAGHVSNRVHTAEVLRSGALWSHMKPTTIARDTWSDLRGGVDLLGSSGPYRPSAVGHVRRPVDAVDNPLAEYSHEVRTTWAQHKAAGAFAAVGNEAAARALTHAPAGAGRWWVATSGSVQVVESTCGLSPLTPVGVLQDACTLDVGGTKSD